MSKGTKQIRLGRVAALKDKLENYRDVSEAMKNETQDADTKAWAKGAEDGFRKALDLLAAAFPELDKGVDAK